MHTCGDASVPSKSYAASFVDGTVLFECEHTPLGMVRQWQLTDIVVLRRLGDDEVMEKCEAAATHKLDGEHFRVFTVGYDGSVGAVGPSSDVDCGAAIATS